MSASIPSWVRVGAKVQCVDVRPSYLNGATLDANAVYTILSVGGSYFTGIAVAIDGPDSGWRFAQPHGAWVHTRFRPLVEPKSEAEDVALFKHHLSQPQPVDA